MLSWRAAGLLDHPFVLVQSNVYIGETSTLCSRDSQTISLVWTLNADGKSKVTKTASHHLRHNGWRKPSVLMHHQLIDTHFGWLSCMKTDLNHQLIVVSEEGEQGREGSVARSLRKTREMFFNEKYPWNRGSALVFRTVEKVANSIQSVPDEIAIISTEASALFSFPPGHPRRKLVYARHPSSSTLYYPVASFHRKAFEHKFAEAIRLLTSLGAKKIRVEHEKGWGRGFGVDFSASVPEANAQGSADFSSSNKADDHLLFVATLKGHTAPKIPDNLVWFPHESVWQQIARDRIDCGLEDFDLTISYSDDFGVNAKLIASLTKGSFELGGTFEEHESTTWRITGEFSQPLD
ncbi:hypothetical protein [Pseudomonas sp. NPDC087817]|uniref:hypothetical protein n=1 Tax=Pseudomonas sp. NPDC087817 TaxID=3364451 RepID=UPI003808E158